MTQLQELLEQIRSLEARVRDEIQRQARDFGYTLRRGRVIFERDVIRHHKRKARRLWRYLFSSPLELLFSLIRLSAFYYKFNKWKHVVVPKYKWLFKNFEVTTALFKKNSEKNYS